MGMVMELSDALGYCDYADVDYASDLTDTESEGEYAFTPRAFELTVPRSSKRTYGVVVDNGGVVSSRRKRSRVDEQLELLRAAIPNLCTDEKTSILAGACEYIEQLQRQVQELHYELDTNSACSDEDEDDDMSSCKDALSTEEIPVTAIAVLDAACRKCSHVTIEVEGTEEGLRIHIECERRPRVLAEILEVLESSGMNVEEVSIDYHDDFHFSFDCIGSEVNGKDVSFRECVETSLKYLIVTPSDSYLV